MQKGLRKKAHALTRVIRHSFLATSLKPELWPQRCPRNCSSNTTPLNTRHSSTCPPTPLVHVAERRHALELPRVQRHVALANHMASMHAVVRFLALRRLPHVRSSRHAASGHRAAATATACRACPCCCCCCDRGAPTLTPHPVDPRPPGPRGACCPATAAPPPRAIRRPADAPRCTCQEGTWDCHHRRRFCWCWCHSRWAARLLARGWHSCRLAAAVRPLAAAVETLSAWHPQPSG
jgi:hypothetical protein